MGCLLSISIQSCSAPHSVPLTSAPPSTSQLAGKTPTPFEDEISAESVLGKVFAFKNLEGSIIDSTLDEPLFRRQGDIDVETYSGEQFMLFHVGNYSGHDCFAIARYVNGHIVDVAGNDPTGLTDRWSSVQIHNQWSRDWKTDNQVFRFDKSASNPAGTQGPAYTIKVWHGQLCIDGGKSVQNIYAEVPNGHVNQLWQLYVVDTVENNPNIKPVAQDKRRKPNDPTWTRNTAPDPDSNSPDEQFVKWQDLGYALLPYFAVENPSLWNSIAVSSETDPIYYALRREQHWDLVNQKAQDPNAAHPLDYSQTFNKGFSKSALSSFSSTVGIEVTASVGAAIGSLSATVSAELAWGWEVSTSTSEEVSTTTQFKIDPGEVYFFWQVEERLTLLKAWGDSEAEWIVAGDWVLKTGDDAHTVGQL